MAEDRFDEGDFEELASELRQSVGRELRWEAEDLEQLTDKQRRRRRTMTDVAEEAMHRGDLVMVSREEVQHRGVIVAAAADLVVLETGMGLVNVHLPETVVAIVQYSRSGGTTGDRGARTFRGRLAELEHSGEEVVIEGDELELKGRLTVAASDHVSIVDADGREWFVPHQRIWFVIQPRG